MALIVSTGSNLGDRKLYLSQAKEKLSQQFVLEYESRIYESPAVDYLKQPDFLNQVLQFRLPNLPPEESLKICFEIEQTLGRQREIDKGPRTLDIDLLFWNTQKIETKNLIIPHPRLFERSFIVEPLKELPFFDTLKNFYDFPKSFSNHCHAIS